MKPERVALFWAKVNKIERGCWEWLASKTKAGYGKFGMRPAQAGWKLAHRLAYELLVGPIPENLTIDHLCRNRGCVNPEHLEPVPRAVNTMRGTGVGTISASKTQCPQGHAYAGDNLIRDGSSRKCRTCRKAFDKKRRPRKEIVPVPRFGA